MTKLEAIAFFMDMDECTYGGSEPIQMAIEALKQEPCEDAISRSSVFEIMGNLMSIPYDLDRPINKKDVSDSMGEIRALPPVKPARRKGKWIATTEISTNKRGQIVHEVICSECNGISYFRGMDGKYIGANLCPNCGAEMENEE